MTLLGSRLNSARYTSLLADIATQFGSIPAGLQASEIATITAHRQKLAHAISDNEGTDIVTEFVTNGTVPNPIPVTVNIGTGVGSTTAPGTIL